MLDVMSKYSSIEILVDMQQKLFLIEDMWSATKVMRIWFSPALFTVVLK